MHTYNTKVNTPPGPPWQGCRSGTRPGHASRPRRGGRHTAGAHAALLGLALTAWACLPCGPAASALAGSGAGEYPAARAFIAGEQPMAVEAAYAFLRGPAPDGYGGASYDAMKDALLIRLLQIEPQPGDLVASLCAIVSDPEAERVGRIYSAQYLSRLYPRAAKGRDGQRASLILSTLRGALHAPCPWLAGTALLQLGELCRDYPEVDQARVVQSAIALTGHEGAAARVAALQIAVSLHEPRLLDAARQAAAPESPGALQAAALHALGALGDTTDIVLLHRMAREPDSQYPAVALGTAIRRLEARLALADGHINEECQ